MMDGGCDLAYLARRIVRMASEDIGNADPRVLQIAINAWEAQECLGSPESELALAQAIVYLAFVPPKAMPFIRHTMPRCVMPNKAAASVCQCI
jgi:replication-associated recombination protein RarA